MSGGKANQKRIGGVRKRFGKRWQEGSDEGWEDEKKLVGRGEFDRETGGGVGEDKEEEKEEEKKVGG